MKSSARSASLLSKIGACRGVVCRAAASSPLVVSQSSIPMYVPDMYLLAVAISGDPNIANCSVRSSLVDKAIPHSIAHLKHA